MKSDVRKDRVTNMEANAIQKLWKYDGLIYDMGILFDDNSKPFLDILTESSEHIEVSIANLKELDSVIQFLEKLDTDIDIEFHDICQFINLVKNVFEVYIHRTGIFYDFDNTELNMKLEQLKPFATQTDVAREAGIGRSTVNDLARGITHHPRYDTICKVYSALDRLEHYKDDIYEQYYN